MIIPMTQKCSKAAPQKVQSKGLYISSINNVPDEALEGLYGALRSARPDHMLGMYCYFFSPISRGSLSERFIIKNKDFGNRKLATIFYVQKHIIDPVHFSIKNACKGTPYIGIITSNSECRIAQRSNASLED